MNAEQTSAIEPHLPWSQTGATRQSMEFLNGIFIGILGMNAVSRFKME